MLSWCDCLNDGQLPVTTMAPRHRLVACADADAALHQMLLEVLHIIRRRRLWRAPEPGRKSFAGAQK